MPSRMNTLTPDIIQSLCADALFEFAPAYAPYVPTAPTENPFANPYAKTKPDIFGNDYDRTARIAAFQHGVHYGIALTALVRFASKTQPDLSELAIDLVREATEGSFKNPMLRHFSLLGVAYGCESTEDYLKGEAA